MVTSRTAGLKLPTLDELIDPHLETRVDDDFVLHVIASQGSKLAEGESIPEQEKKTTNSDTSNNDLAISLFLKPILSSHHLFSSSQFIQQLTDKSTTEHNGESRYMLLHPQSSPSSALPSSPSPSPSPTNTSINSPRNRRRHQRPHKRHPPAAARHAQHILPLQRILRPPLLPRALHLARLRPPRQRPRLALAHPGHLPLVPHAQPENQPHRRFIRYVLFLFHVCCPLDKQ